MHRTLFFLALLAATAAAFGENPACLLNWSRDVLDENGVKTGESEACADLYEITLINIGIFYSLLYLMIKLLLLATQ